MESSKLKQDYVEKLTAEIMGVFELDLDISDLRYQILNKEVSDIISREYVEHEGVKK